MQAQNIQISKLQINTGQIEGLPKNPRLIKDEKFKQLVKSIEDDPEMMDLRECIVYPQNGHFVVIAGNMRLQACKQLNYKEVPCKILPKETTVDKLKAYTIKDNIGYGEHNWEMLSTEWDTDQLIEWGLDLPDFINKKEAIEDDYVIPDEIETDIVHGDLFEIGQHRLLCGDSTKAEDVTKLLDGAKPNLMVTDPPYGVEYSAGWRNEAMPDKKDPKRWKEKGTGRAIGKVENDNNADWTEAWALSPAKVAYVYHAGVYSGTVQKSLEDCDFNIRAQIIWVKSHFAISRADYHWKHEPCWYAVKKGNKGNWAGDRKQTTVWDIPKPQKSETGHSTQKPIECMARPMRNHDGDVYEPFSGSGTAIVAGHQLGKKVYAMELKPEYCQCTIDRMKKLDPNIEIKKNGVPYATT